MEVVEECSLSRVSVKCKIQDVSTFQGQALALFISPQMVIALGFDGPLFHLVIDLQIETNRMLDQSINKHIQDLQMIKYIANDNFQKI